MIVEARQVRKAFGDVIALDTIDLNIEAGQIVGIIGPSGAGKTTMIRLLLGLYAPTEGDISVFGGQPESFSRVDRERIGYLPQNFLLYEDLTVEENLLFAAGIYGLGPRDRRERIPDLIEMVRLTDAKDRLARDISGGMQRRLALASTLIHRPDLIVLDEPTAGIDPVLRAAIWDIFHELKDQGAAIIVTTQYVTEAEYCDYVYLINGGLVAASGTPEELRQAAFGGEVIRIKLNDLNRELINDLYALPFVHSGSRVSNDELHLVVEDAGQAIPELAAELRNRGYDIAELEELQSSFDNIFVELVERSDSA